MSNVSLAPYQLSRRTPYSNGEFLPTENGYLLSKVCSPDRHHNERSNGQHSILAVAPGDCGKARRERASAREREFSDYAESEKVFDSVFDRGREVRTVG